MAPDEIHWREREWLTGGRFVVTAADHREDVDRVEVHPCSSTPRRVDVP